MPPKARPVYHELEDPLSINEYSNQTLPALDIKGTKYKAKYTSFDNIVFEGIVHIDDCDLMIGLSFTNCTFTKPVALINIKAHGYDLLLQPDSRNLTFIDCTFNEIVIINGLTTNIEREVYFQGCTFNNDLKIEKLNVREEGLSIRNCTLKKTLDLLDAHLKQNLSISGNNISGEVRVGNLKSSAISILENTFNDFFHIRFAEIENGLIFNNGQFKKEVQITHVLSAKGGLHIIGVTFEKTVSVEFHNNKHKPTKGFYKFYLGGSKFNDGIYINGKQDLLADDPFVEEICITASPELKGNIIFRNLHLGILELSGNNTSANIQFEYLFINQIKIKAFMNNSGLVFSGIKASYETWVREEKSIRENALYIDSSNFGKAQFYQVDFSSFDKIVFHNNILTDISTSLTKWFAPEQLDREENALLAFRQAVESKDKWRINNNRDALVSAYKSLQEIYRQLKYASQKQGDIAQSLEFQRHEMNYYRKIIKYKKPRKWNEHFILWTNQTNDFGQDWIKALKLLALFTFISYVPIGFLISDQLDYAHFASSWSDVWINIKVIFYDNIKNWLIILNPTHRIKDLDENIENYSSWVYLWDFLSRIIVSYFIFQVISAFRKFNK